MQSSPGTVAQQVAEFFGSTKCAEIAAVKSVVLPGDVPPWQSTGLHLQRGQTYSLFADGVIQWSERRSHLHGGPPFHLWARVYPGGRAVNLCANSGTFVADVNGELELGIYMGMWADEFGKLQSSEALYQSLSGQIEATIALYSTDALAALESVCAEAYPPEPIEAEILRLRAPKMTPPGWHYLHETGYAEIYQHEHTASGSIIHAHADDDQGILRHPVDFPLTSSTTMQWRWQVHEHPSVDPEDQAISHDYISLAAEFDNGRDLTWIWSCCLKPGEFFQCPIRVWQERETHYVIRSHNDALGQWYVEKRNVYDDVFQAMGPPPERITAVWLIALSTFHHRVARASFAEIKLTNDEFEVWVI